METNLIFLLFGGWCLIYTTSIMWHLFRIVNAAIAGKGLQISFDLRLKNELRIILIANFSLAIWFLILLALKMEVIG